MDLFEALLILFGFSGATTPSLARLDILLWGFRLVICGDGNMKSLLCLKRHIVDYIGYMKT